MTQPPHDASTTAHWGMSTLGTVRALAVARPPGSPRYLSAPGPWCDETPHPPRPAKHSRATRFKQWLRFKNGPAVGSNLCRNESLAAGRKKARTKEKISDSIRQPLRWGPEPRCTSGALAAVSTRTLFAAECGIAQSVVGQIPDVLAPVRRIPGRRNRRKRPYGRWRVSWRGDDPATHGLVPDVLRLPGLDRIGHPIRRSQ